MDNKPNLAQAARDEHLRAYLTARLEAVKNQLVNASDSVEIFELQGRARELKKLLTTLRKHEG